MMFWALVFAADMVAGLTDVEVKNLRRNEMVGNCLCVTDRMMFLYMVGRRGKAFYMIRGERLDVNLLCSAISNGL
jgi:hypothetical protein